MYFDTGESEMGKSRWHETTHSVVGPVVVSLTLEPQTAFQTSPISYRFVRNIQCAKMHKDTPWWRLQCRARLRRDHPTGQSMLRFLWWIMPARGTVTREDMPDVVKQYDHNGRGIHRVQSHVFDVDPKRPKSSLSLIHSLSDAFWAQFNRATY
jgi:hypothetical protein